MHQYASEYIKMYAERIVQRFCARNYQRSGFYLMKIGKIDDFPGNKPENPFQTVTSQEIVHIIHFVPIDRGCKFCFRALY